MVATLEALLSRNAASPGLSDMQHAPSGDTKVSSFEPDEYQGSGSARSLFFDILSAESDDLREEKLKRAGSSATLRRGFGSRTKLTSEDMDEGRRTSMSTDADMCEGGAQRAHSRMGRGFPSVESLLGLETAEEQELEPPELLKELCGDMYIEATDLEDMVPLGEGAFAVVHRCVLRRSTHGGSNSGGNEHGHGEAGTDDRQSFAAPAPAPAPALEVVAVKQLKTNVLENEAELNAFVAEVDVLRRLRHPSIVEFKGLGAFHMESLTAMRHSMFLVQEFMVGGTLKDLVLDVYYGVPGKPLYSRQDALRWALEIAQALHYLHSFHPMVVHRDLKLENILLTSPDPSRAAAKLADFGLHKMVKDVASGVPLAESSSQALPTAAVALEQSAGRATPKSPARPDAPPTAAEGAPGGADKQAAPTRATNPLARSSAATPSANPLLGAGAQRSHDASGSQTVKQPDRESFDWHPSALPGRGPAAPTTTMSERATEPTSLGAQEPALRARVQEWLDQPAAVDDAWGNRDHVLSGRSRLGSQSITLAALGTERPAFQGLGVAERIRMIRATRQDLEAPLPPPDSALAPSQRGDQGLGPTGSAEGRAGSLHRVDSVGLSRRGGVAAGGGRPHTSGLGLTVVPQPCLGSCGGGTPNRRSGGDSTPNSRLSAARKLQKLLRVPPLSMAMSVTTPKATAGEFDAMEYVYEMTGQTGSLCYMAPEVLLGCFYNQKVDVFSFAVVFWEVLNYMPIIATIPGQEAGYNREMVFHYAEEVAGGFRQPIPPGWPPEVRSLIADCWHQNPAMRPQMATVVKRLTAIHDSGIDRAWDAACRPKKGSAACSCCCQ